MKNFTYFKKMVFVAFLVTAMGALTNVSAQVLTDETPENWKFDTHSSGDAKDLFIVEGVKIGGNVSYPFRLADSKDGAFVMNSWQGASDIAYGDMTDEQKKLFTDFYDACQIVDAGTMGKIFCYQGVNSTATDARAQKNINTGFVAPSMNILTATDHPFGNYRITLTLRLIANEGTEADKMNVYVGSSHWDGIDGLGGTGDGYRQFDINYAPAYNPYWVSYAFDFRIKENSDESYNVLPINTKLGIGGFVNNGMILMDDIKLEKIQAVEDNYMPVKQKVENGLDDTPSAISFVKKDDLIVFANNGVINVIDAKTPIEVYTVSGKLLAKKQPSSTTLTTFAFNEKGIYIVKVDNQTHKVIL